MKTQHILLTVAGVGLVYYLYQKSNSKEVDLPDTAAFSNVNKDEIPMYTNNDLKVVRRNLHKFIEDVYDTFEIEKDNQTIVGKVMEITAIEPTKKVEVKQSKKK